MSNILQSILQGASQGFDKSIGDPQTGVDYAPALGAMETALKLPKGSLSGNGQPVSADQFKTLTPVIDAYTKGQIAQAMKASQHPSVSPEMATAIASGEQGAVNDQWQKEMGVGTPLPAQFLTLANAARGTGYKGQAADAMTQRSGAQKMMADYTVSGGSDLHQAASRANVTLGQINKTAALIDQIDAQGGSATPPQRAELSRALAAITTSGAGVVTDDAMDQFLPQSLKQKGGHFLEYLSNQQVPINFSGFMPQFRDMLNREKTANQGISNNAADFGLGLIAQSNPQLAARIKGLRTQNPLLNPVAQPTDPQGGGMPATPQNNPAPTVDRTPVTIGNDPEENRAVLAFKQKYPNLPTSRANIDWMKQKLKNVAR